jgi:ATP adenylyltransferase
MVMNRFPYTNGHVMVAPLAHAAGLEELDDAVLLDMTQHIRLAMSLLARVLQPDGYNVGMNFGRCAGAGLPGHTHAHVVPRWAGDTNFMTCTGGVRLIPEDLDELYGRLCTALEDSRERRAASSD